MMKKLHLIFKFSLALICLLSTFLGYSQGSLVFDYSLSNREGVSIPSPSFSNLGASDFTFEANIKPDASQNSQFPMLFSIRGIDKDSGFFVALTNNGGSRYGIRFQINGNNIIRDNLFDKDSGECIHIAVVRNNDLILLFLNGEEIRTLATNNSMSISFDGSAYIGNDFADPGNATTNGFNGEMREVRFWSIARTATELEQFAFESLSNPTALSGLEGYWKFDEGQGTTAADSSGNTNTANLGFNFDGTQIPPPVWDPEATCETLSVIDNQLQAHIKLYPNPTTSTLSLSGVNNFTYKIFDIQGKEVLRGKSSKDISIEGLPQGSYFIKIENGESLNILRFIKK